MQKSDDLAKQHKPADDDLNMAVFRVMHEYILRSDDGIGTLRMVQDNLGVRKPLQEINAELSNLVSQGWLQNIGDNAYILGT